MVKLTFDRYFEALKENSLLGLKCSQCKGYTVPPKATCQSCGSADMEPAFMKGIGAVVTFTVVRVPPEGLEGPYTLVLVELEEGPRLLGRLEGIAADEADMELIGRKAKLGHKVITGLNYTACEGVIPVFSLLGDSE